MSESPDKQHDSAIGVSETTNTLHDSAINVSKTPNTPDDSAFGVAETPNKQVGSAIGVSELRESVTRFYRDEGEQERVKTSELCGKMLLLVS